MSKCFHRKGTTVSDIPFNWPFVVGTELDNLRQAIENRHLSGDGPFTKRCEAWLKERLGCRQALLTHSCTAALEMSAILVDTQPGDEIIMPSFTFVSTANAFVLRSGVPVFVDIRPDTLNLDETKIEDAITDRTRAIVAVHYAGVGCDMDAIMAVASRHGVLVVEDAAQGLMSSYKGRPLGSFGTLAAISFHETKNVIAGEGGALVINDARWLERARIVRDKGTNRNQYFLGEVDKYTWQDIGSSYAPSEITAAFLAAQLDDADRITAERLRLWRHYDAAVLDLEQRGSLRRPIVPDDCRQNAHMYYVLLEDPARRAAVLALLQRRGITAVFHYIPLHGSMAGRKYGRVSGELPHTVDLSERLVRLPMWMGMTEAHVARVVGTVRDALGA